MNRQLSRIVGVVAVATSTALLLGACSDAQVRTATPTSTPTPPTPHLTVDGRTVVVTSGRDRLTLDTRDLATDLHRDDGRAMTVSSATSSNLGASSAPTVDHGVATWHYAGGTTATATADPATGGMTLHVAGPPGTELAWPRTGGDESVGAVQWANGSGQDIPIRDTFWNSEDSGLTGEPRAFAGDLTMPAWGATARKAGLGVAFSTGTDIGSTLGFTSAAAGAGGNVLTATATHAFTDDTPSWDVVVSPTDGSPVGAGVAFRRTLIAADQFVTLDRKTRRNPEIEKLIGAPQAYVWGDGRTSTAVDALRDAGLDRMWLGYDADGDAPGGEFVDAATKAGYLVGPYDSWANAQDPATSDASTSTWPDGLFPGGCVRDADGAVESGFGGRGCYLSSTALAAAEDQGHVLDDRVSSEIANGATSVFLDVDAAGQLFTDSSPAHPQTEAEDRALRLARMRALSAGQFSGGQPLVVGSESAAAWANPGIAFSQGSSTPVFDGLWAAEKDTGTWGAYWPAERPGFFFTPTELPRSLTTAMFDPRYRIPLYETTLHDSVISSDRWELGIGKLPDVRTARALTAMLYDEPVMHTLDADNVSANAGQLAAEQQFFRTIQDAAGTEPMTDYRRLTTNGNVQQTTFGDGALTIVANFGSAASHGVDAGCVTAVVRSGGTSSYCPAAD